MATALPVRDRGRALDRAGLGLAVTSIGWTWWTARSSGGEALPVAALQFACAGCFVAARVVTRWQRPLVPVIVVAGTATLLVLESVLPDLAPLSPPLGYANANAALYVLVAVAAAMMAAAFPPGPATAVTAPLAVAFGVAAVVSGSWTGAAVLVLGTVAVLARLLVSWRSLVGIWAVVAQLAVAISALLGVARAGDTTVAVAEQLVDTRRVLLWRDAAVIAREHPLIGAGPGRFQKESPTARADADARWAHSGFLQQGAEQGAVGLTLLLAAFGWGFVRLWSSTAEDAFVTLGAVALGALALHASVDYVLHFAAVPLVASALVGAATAWPAAPGTPGRPAPPAATGSLC